MGSFTQTAAAEELDEQCFLSAQSMQSLNISEHFQLVKLLGEGTYGKVMLAVHKKRGWSISYPLHIASSSISMCNQQNTISVVISDHSH